MIFSPLTLSKKKRNSRSQETAIIDQSLIDASKALFANICFTKVDSDIKTICVTSSHASEGKSTTSLNLAIAIAQSGKKTLLVENDMRKRTLSKALKLAGEHDICDLIRGNVRIEDAVISTGYENLYFLDVAPGVPSPSDILSSERYAKLVQRLRERFDYVIFDTPPTLLFVDSAIVSNLVDGTLLVVKERSTKKSAAEKALAQLEKANANVIGVSMSYCQVTKDDYYYYSYYSEDGEKIRKSKKTSSASPNINWSDMERKEKPVWDVDIEDDSDFKLADSAGEAPGEKDTATSKSTAENENTKNSEDGVADSSESKDAKIDDAVVEAKKNEQKESQVEEEPPSDSDSTDGSKKTSSPQAKPSVSRARRERKRR